LSLIIHNHAIKLHITKAVGQTTLTVPRFATQNIRQSWCVCVWAYVCACVRARVLGANWWNYRQTSAACQISFEDGMQYRTHCIRPLTGFCNTVLTMQYNTLYHKLH